MNKKKKMWTLSKSNLNNENQTPPTNASNPPTKKIHGIDGKQRGGHKGERINPLMAQRNA